MHVTLAPITATSAEQRGRSSTSSKNSSNSAQVASASGEVLFADVITVAVAARSGAGCGDGCSGGCACEEGREGDGRWR